MRHGQSTQEASTATREETFKVRETARRRHRRVAVPLPEELVVHDDGSAVASYEDGERLTRFPTIQDCLAFHDLRAVDLEPAD